MNVKHQTKSQKQNFKIDIMKSAMCTPGHSPKERVVKFNAPAYTNIELLVTSCYCFVHFLWQPMLGTVQFNSVML